MKEDYFDFHVIDEEEQNLDYKNLVSCPHCKKPIPFDAIMCYYCGEEIVYNKKPWWVAWIIVLIVISFLVFIIS